jgi:alkaline phosphatase
MRRVIKIYGTFLIILLALLGKIPLKFSGFSGVKESENSYIDFDDLNQQGIASNLSIILMIGDGMGYEHIKLARLVELGIDTSFGFETLPYNSNVSTRSADNLITDSAAAATAMATGMKTNNGMLSVLPNLNIIETILEIAQNVNKSTGMVTTTSITHATPAAFMTHVPSRYSTVEIARQIVEESGVDVMLGGGSSYFSAGQISELESKGLVYAENNSILMNCNSSKVIGLFAAGDFPYEESRNPLLTPSLYNMTRKAIELLSKNSHGFFLMIEGGKIDHAAHAHNKTNLALETIEFNAAIEYAMEYCFENNNTLLLITADHETGGLRVLDYNLNETLPSVLESYEERKNLRIQRANNISVSWSSTSHTATNVPIYIYNPIFSELENTSLINNTEVFDIMEYFFYYEDGNTNLPNTTIAGYQLVIIIPIIVSVVILIKRKAV